jgi:hypothetical protein
MVALRRCPASAILAFGGQIRKWPNLILAVAGISTSSISARCSITRSPCPIGQGIKRSRSGATGGREAFTRAAGSSLAGCGRPRNGGALSGPRRGGPVGECAASCTTGICPHRLEPSKSPRLRSQRERKPSNTYSRVGACQRG